jgi:hypothetical protein
MSFHTIIEEDAMSAQKAKDYFNLAREFTMYLNQSKSYWLAPAIFVFLLLSALAFFLEGSVVAPAIYAVF